MKLYLLLMLVVLVTSCNNSSDKAHPIAVDTQLDSLIESTDSINYKLMAIDTLATKAFFTTQSEIRQLRQEKKELVKQLETKYPTFNAIQSDDEHLKRINELNKLLIQKEFENTQLRRKIYYDSISRTRSYNSVGNRPERIIEHDPILPDSKSLIITLGKKIKRDGSIADNLISVYVIDYNKKSKKAMTNYDNCDMSKLNKLNNRRALYYNGYYFINDLPAGKYIIKVCSIYGGFKVIERQEESYQVVAMQVAPPIQ